MDEDVSYMEEGEENGEENSLDPDDPHHAFVILERKFNKVVSDMEQNPAAAQYAEEFTNLFDALYKSHEKETQLNERCQDVEYELETNMRKLESAIKLTETDQLVIDDLKDQIQKAWKMADAAHAREQTAQEIIENLRKQVESLNAEIELRNKFAAEQAEDTGVMSKKKEGLQREKERLQGEVVQLSQKLQNALGYQEELEHKNSAADIKITELSAQVDDQTGEIDRHKRQVAKLNQDISEVKEKLSEKELQLNELTEVVGYHMKQIARLENQLKDEKTNYERLYKDHEALNAKHYKVYEDLQVAQSNYEQTRKTLNKKELELKNAEDTVNHLRNDVTKLTKMKDLYDKKLLAMDSDKNDVVQDRNKLRQRLVIIEKEVDDMKKQADAEKRAMDSIAREKEIMNKSIMRQQGVAQEQQKLIKIQEQQKKKLENELDLFYLETNKQKKIISRLERERERLADEHLDMTRQIEEAMDQIKLKKTQIFELKKVQSEQVNKYRMQQNLFDITRAERNSLQKQLQESNAECNELKKKLRIIAHQTEQLKEDISMKESTLIKEENILRKAMKDKEYLKMELTNTQDQVKKLKEEIQMMSEEERRLHQSLMNNERLIREQAKDLEQLLNERDILGAQLVRRNDEIGLLHEKINIFQSTLERGETQYDQRLDDIKLLKIEIKRLRQEKILLTKSADNVSDLRQEVFHLERDLTRARLKCRALEEEVQNPLNVHRWRKLEGSDPEVMDLLQKIQLLQKRLLHQSSEAVERERQLKEVQRLYLNLRQVLAQQPSPSVKEELNKTQKALRLRGNKLKCLVSELNMAEYQAKEYQISLQKVTDELKDLKKKYLADKKKEELRSSAQNSAKGDNVMNQGQTKFTGGGFRVK
ncbi:cilia- and flagella-associated protein 58-like [Coccinella septempunctata]|uniref:cilia- and flagella-associated protein 58-like n=1 Tax=Coccinella septempunctata TaxID=41139 RepID=UPI001D05F083|nr:cilia- and flagella-associated protein 58-like [Coccinella septempunctata]XP_044753435.1 cilia- and flagella-associated protein 58-like [Coccinella septempunctata]